MTSMGTVWRMRNWGGAAAMSAAPSPSAWPFESSAVLYDEAGAESAAGETPGRDARATTDHCPAVTR